MNIMPDLGLVGLLYNVKMPSKNTLNKLLYSTASIWTERDNVPSVGTGCFFAYDLQNHFLITNKHVIGNEDQITVKLIVERRNDNNYQFFHDVITNKNSWVPHPDDDIDLCICPMNVILQEVPDDLVPVSRSIYSNLVPTKEDIEQIDVMEDIIFLGYPSHLWDQNNLFPLIRKGITATPIHLDHRNNPIFLIDASVFPGSSGSPVFLYSKNQFLNEDLTYNVERIHFLGIISEGSYEQKINEFLVGEKTYHLKMRETENLGSVVKCDPILDLIKSSIKNY